MVPKPLLRCASQVLDRGVQADARGATRCLSQVLGRGTQADARRCLSQVLSRGTQAVARGAAKPSQQEQNSSLDVQRNRANITGFISPTHKRTEGRAPVWGSEFTSKRRRTTGGDPAETAVG